MPMTAVHPTVLQAVGMRSSVPIARRRGHLRHRHHSREAIPRRREDLRGRLLRRVPLRHPAVLPRPATLRGEAVRTAMVDLTVEETAAATLAVHHTAAADHFHFRFCAEPAQFGQALFFLFLVRLRLPPLQLSESYGVR
jgi:hypothetical protein